MLGDGETAEKTKNSLWAKIKEDTTEERNLEDYIKRRLIAFSSDGASVMIGKRQSLWVLIKKEIGRDIPAIICMAHKLENSIKRGIKSSTDTDLQYFSQFNKSINKFYVFYSSRGSKRWASLEQTAEELGLRAHRIKYFFDIRWSASHFICLENLYKNYVQLIGDTTKISKDASFTKAANAEAKELSQKLLNKSWALVLHEFLDILTVYKQVSLDLQVQAGLLPGKAGIIKIAIQKLELLKSETGAFVNDFLSKTTCPLKPCVSEAACTMQEFEDCKTAMYVAKYELTDNDGEKISLSSKRGVLYDSIISGINHYFNINELDHFEVFNHQLYPVPLCDNSGPNNLVTFDTPKHQEDLQFLGEFYGMSAEDILSIKTNWETFLQEVTSSTIFSQNKKEPFEVFWPLILKNELNQTPHLTRAIASLISKMLVTPFSSAEAERAFSFVTREKSGSRSSMTPETLDRIMRISLNGKRTYAYFDALGPTLKWLKEHSRVDDASFQEPRNPHPRQWNNFLPQNTLF